MGDKKSNSDNEEDQDKRSIQDRINYQQIQQQIIKDMNKQIGSVSSGNSTDQLLATSADTSNNSCIKLLADKVVDINVLKFELDKLPLDFKARAYFENDVKPLLDTLYTLSIASLDFSATAVSLTNTSFGRSSKIKNALELTDSVDEISSDVIKVLRCKVDNMLKLSKCD
ncbi:hypothetical protein LL033_21200 [Clostridium estertheticum]|uniref:hypothetical protein n=1 Tax=Clostridium estertheticum TaxID=238834 RepID=UPI001C0D1A25|nr:hypothetical protein [Clostridium estertheticum]MBU3216136.1 hypothetical protein [Clostridium estertheticum]MBW9152711.1 hypothetical protein [Clostridium estertheticum]WAG55091.1 hypothetical protein LL033_21200 [Clostridium estertheticum]WLC85673.1 hypothetical protein KTC97_08010 [Clostridium estertheticum]